MIDFGPTAQSAGGPLGKGVACWQPTTLGT